MRVPKLLPATVIPVATDKYLSKYCGVIVIVGELHIQVPMPYKKEKVMNIMLVVVANEDKTRELAQMIPPEDMTLLLPKRPTRMLVTGPKVIERP